MPTAAAPFPSSQPPAPGTNALYPALYLYPLNDTWTPKHISLTNQHTKIGRQTSSKTAPGERNGFFDSKVLSRQHAEVWEENSKIYIKDVRSSNGTFINGDRLSGEGQESDPFELKSDDIVEFGIDIVGEDNKTIIHHKVAARVVCVFNEQDAQVAARAEQHQQHQQLQQQQYLQQQGSAGASSSIQAAPGAAAGANVQGTIGGSGGPQNFPFAAQRRAQLAQQGLGGMGGIRPPGKTGLSFDVILSRLQGELQKSRETGAELNTITGAMNDIQDTLGGNLPTTLPPFPHTLPPVRPQQDGSTGANAAASSSSGPSAPASNAGGSPEQAVSQTASSISASAVEELQAQLRDTQSSLSSHLDKVRALEGVLAEQEAMKRDVRALKDMMDERRREIEMVRSHGGDRSLRELENVDRGRSLERSENQDGRREEDIEPRGGFDLEDEEEGMGLHDMDDDDDTRSIATVMPHELERVEEEDEEQLAEAHRQVDEPESVRPLEEGEEERERSEEEQHRANAEDEERRRQDLNVGRPRTPEPTRLGLLGSTRRGSLSSPLSHTSTSELRNASSTSGDDIYDQVIKMSKQLSSVMQTTSTLEAQHSAAQTTIKALEGKVETLEVMLKSAEDALAKAQTPPPSHSNAVVEDPVPRPVEEKPQASLVEMMAEWKKSVEGKWGSVQEEWSQERERLSRAREEFESKLKQVDSGLEKVASLQSILVSQQQQVQAQIQQQQQQLSALNVTTHGISHLPFHHLNGELVKHNGGLVTPPSPRSQSSDSGRFRRRRRRSSGRGGRGRSSSGGRAGSDSGGEDVADDDADTDATLASSTEDDAEAKHRAMAFGESVSSKAASLGAALVQAGVHLATPASSVGSLEADADSSKGKAKGKDLTSTSTRSNSEDMNSSYASGAGSKASSLVPSSSSPANINTQAAVGVVLLAVAAAAVFWKVKPE